MNQYLSRSVHYLCTDDQIAPDLCRSAPLYSFAHFVILVRFFRCRPPSAALLAISAGSVVCCCKHLQGVTQNIVDGGSAQKCENWSIKPAINSLVPGKFELNFRYMIFKRILVIDGWGISCEIGLIGMSFDFIDDQSTFVEVMAWCRQATSHYLSQCWPRSMLPNGVTRPQWVKTLSPELLTNLLSITIHHLCCYSLRHCLIGIGTPIINLRAPSQYKDRLIYVWRFPC